MNCRKMVKSGTIRSASDVSYFQDSKPVVIRLGSCLMVASVLPISKFEETMQADAKLERDSLH